MSSKERQTIQNAPYEQHSQLVLLLLALVVIATTTTGQHQLALAQSTQKVFCCPPPLMGPPRSSCQFNIDTRTNPSRIALAEDCNHPQMGILLDIKGNNTKFMLRDSIAKFVRIEGEWLENIEITVENSTLESLEIVETSLQQSSVVVDRSNFSFTTTMTNHSAINITSSTLSAVSLSITTTSVAISATSNATFVVLDNVVAKGHSSITIENVSSHVQSVNGNATSISIGNSLLTDGFKINATSWSNEATTSASARRGTAGLLAVHSQSTINGGTKFLFENVTSTSESTGTSAAVFAVKLMDTKAEPTSEDTDKNTLTIDVRGVLSAKTGLGAGEGAHLFHFHDNVVLRNVAIKGSPAAPSLENRSSKESSSAGENWTAHTLSGYAVVRVSLVTFRNVQGSNVSITFNDIPILLTCRMYLSLLTFVENVTLEALSVELSRVDLTIESVDFAGSLVFMALSSIHAIELRNPTIRIDGGSSPTSSGSSAVKIHSAYGNGCMVKSRGTSATSGGPPLWHNLTMELSNVHTFHCSSNEGDTRYIDFSDYPNIPPVGTIVTLHNTTATVTSSQTSRNIVLFWLSATVRNLRVSFLHNSSLECDTVGNFMALFYEPSTCVLESPNLLTVTNSNLRFVSPSDMFLMYSTGTLGGSGTDISFTNSTIFVQAAKNSFLMYRSTRKDVDRSANITATLTISNCDVKIVSSGSSSPQAVLYRSYFVPNGFHQHVNVEHSTLVLNTKNIATVMHFADGKYKQAAEDEGIAPPLSKTMIKLNNCSVNMDNARSIVVQGLPTATPFQSLEVDVQRSSFLFYSRLGNGIDRASVVTCDRCLNVSVQFHENNVSVPNKDYRGSAIIDLENEAIPSTPSGHVVNISKSQFTFRITKSYSTSSGNLVSVASVAQTAGPVAITATNVEIDFSIGRSTVLTNAFFNLDKCTPNCEAHISYLNVTIDQVDTSSTKPLAIVAAVSDSATKTIQQTHLTLRHIRINLGTLAAFFGINILGFHNEISIDVQDVKGVASNAPGSPTKTILDINSGTVTQMNATMSDISLTGGKWSSVGRFATSSITNAFILDSQFVIRGVSFKVDTDSSTIRLWMFQQGRDMKNTTFNVSDAVIDMKATTRTDLFEIEVNVDRSTLSLSNATILRSEAQQSFMSSVYWGQFSNGSRLLLSDITGTSNATLTASLLLFKERASLSSGSEVLLENVRYNASTLQVAETSAGMGLVSFSEATADASAKFVVSQCAVVAEGAPRGFLIHLDKSTLHMPIVVRNVEIDIVSRTDTATLFSIHMSTIGGFQVRNMSSSRFYGSKEASLYNVESAIVQQRTATAIVQFEDLRFPNIFVGFNASPPEEDEDDGKSTDNGNEHATTSRPLAVRYVSVINDPMPMNTKFIFTDVEFTARLEDAKSERSASIFQMNHPVSTTVEVKHCRFNINSTNSTQYLVAVAQTSNFTNTAFTFEDSTFNLRSELWHVMALNFGSPAGLFNTTFDFNNVHIKGVAGGRYGVSVSVTTALATTEGTAVSFTDSTLEMAFIHGNQRSSQAQRGGDNGLGYIQTRYTTAFLVASSSWIHEEDTTVVPIVFNRVRWIVPHPSDKLLSPPHRCALVWSLSNRFQPSFSHMKMQLQQRTSMLNFLRIGNFQTRLNHSANNTLIGKTLLQNSTVHLQLGNETEVNRTFKSAAGEEISNVTAVISYEVGFPAALDIVNTDIHVYEPLHSGLAMTCASFFLLWAWTHAETHSSNISSPDPYPQLTFSGSKFRGSDHAIGHSVNITSENIAAQPPQIRLNCSAFNGKRLTAEPYFSDVLPLSAVTYWPHSLLDQEHLVCPFSTTASPSVSGRTSSNSQTLSPSSSMSSSSPPSVTSQPTVTQSISSSRSLSPTVSRSPPTPSPTSTTSSSISRTRSNSYSFTRSPTWSESVSLSPNTTFTMELTQSLSATETVTASAGNVSLSCSEGTASTSQTVSRTPSTTLVHALPRCHHAHIQLVLLKDGSQADKQLLFDREFEPDSAHRNVTDRPEVSLSTLQGTEMSAYLFLTNDTAASWTSLATESGRVRLLCDADDSSSGCASGLRSALRTTPIVAEQLSPFLLKLRLGPYSGFDIEGSSTLLIQIGEAVVGCSEMPASQYAQDLRVTVPEVAEVAVQAAATSTIAAASVVGAAASPAMLMDAQSLATFSLISCSSGSDRYAMQPAMFLLSPFSLGPEPDGYVWTNILLLFLILLPFVAVLLFTLRKNPSGGLKDPCTTARFPSMYYSIAMVFHQGTAVLSMRMLFDGRWSGASVLGSLWSVLFPALIYLTFRFKVAREVVNIESEDKLIFYRYDDEVSWSWPDNAVMRWAKRYAFPVGRWGPSSVRKRFGGPISPVLPTWTLYATLPLVQAVLVSFVASIHAGSMTGCMCQYAVLTIFFVCFGVAVTVLKPYRAGLLNAFQAASYFLLASILVCSAALAYSSKFSSARSVLSGLMMLQMGLSVVRTVYLVPLKLGEIFFWGKFCMTTEYNALRDNNQTQSLFFEAFGGVDEEMLVAERKRRVEWRESTKHPSKRKLKEHKLIDIDDLCCDPPKVGGCSVSSTVAIDVDSRSSPSGTQKKTKNTKPAKTISATNNNGKLSSSIGSNRFPNSTTVELEELLLR